MEGPIRHLQPWHMLEVMQGGVEVGRGRVVSCVVGRRGRGEEVGLRTRRQWQVQKQREVTQLDRDNT